MTGYETGILGEKFKKTTICIDENGIDWKGKIYNSILNKEITFYSVNDLVIKLEELMDVLCYPQRGTDIRSFANKNKERTLLRKERLKSMEASKDIELKGKKATFVVKVAYRQNSSWQGEITWVEENKTQRFRSALELIKLIDSTGGILEIEKDWFS